VSRDEQLIDPLVDHVRKIVFLPPSTVNSCLIAASWPRIHDSEIPFSLREYSRRLKYRNAERTLWEKVIFSAL
jgi:hypothetical protein